MPVRMTELTDAYIVSILSYNTSLESYRLF